MNISFGNFWRLGKAVVNVDYEGRGLRRDQRKVRQYIGYSLTTFSISSRRSLILKDVPTVFSIYTIFQ